MWSARIWGGYFLGFVHLGRVLYLLLNVQLSYKLC
eukprot:SAG31_NODE_20103_length_583_cov_3.663223_1_plen_34_part_10